MPQSESKHPQGRKHAQERTADLIARYKQALWVRFAVRASVVALAIAGGALFFRSLDLVPDLSYVEVSVLSGSPEGNYYATVERLGSSATQGAKIHNVAGPGSRGNLMRLIAAKESCEVQFALVQDGFDWAAYEGLQLVGRVGLPETLLLLGRQADSLRTLSDFAGLTIGIGPEGSGTAFLGEKIFERLGLAALGVKLSNHNLNDQLSLAAAGELDLALFVINEGAALIDRAVRVEGLQLVGLEHAPAIANRFEFLQHGTIAPGHFDPLRVLPATEKPVLRLNTLLVGNGCASHSNVVGLMTLLARIDPNLIERNRTKRAPSGLPFSASAQGFYDNQGAEFADEYVPWLVDIMPPSNWVYTIMAVSLFFNLAGFVNSQRLALIDISRVALENDLELLFGRRVSNEEIRGFDTDLEKQPIERQRLDNLINAYKRQLDKCRRQSLSILSPMGEEMGYRDQEIIMTATLDALRELKHRLDRA